MISPALRQAVQKTTGTHEWMMLVNSGPIGHVGLPAVIGISPVIRADDPEWTVCRCINE